MLQKTFKPRAVGAGAMRKARKLAAAHGITIERVRDSEGFAWWVTHATLELDESYCVDGIDVLAAVTKYIEVARLIYGPDSD
jgi:hypothetical protein